MMMKNKTVTKKSPALWGGACSPAFVKRDAEPSEGECSLGEFFAEILQRLTHLPAFSGREAGFLAVCRCRQETVP